MRRAGAPGRGVGVAVHPAAARVITAAAAAAAPRETGGLLVGWWEPQRIVVAHALEVPDPDAGPHGWTRQERAAQCALDAALRKCEHPWLGYVGDWHSHPAPRGASPTDLCSIRRASRQYRHPLLLLVHRADGLLEAQVAARGRLRAADLTLAPAGDFAEETP